MTTLTVDCVTATATATPAAAPAATAAAITVATAAAGGAVVRSLLLGANTAGTLL